MACQDSIEEITNVTVVRVSNEKITKSESRW